jgi:ubiquinone/menaquinone biosynthesis C-methylase UbiE
MYRILENNGIVVINELTGPKWLRKFMNWCFTKWETGDHAVYSRQEMRQMMEEAGFKNIRSKLITPFTYPKSRVISTQNIRRQERPVCPGTYGHVQ